MFEALRQNAALIHLPNRLVGKAESGADHGAQHVTADARVVTAVTL